MRHSFKKILLTIPFVLLFFLHSCDPNRVFEENKRIEKHKWHYQDTLSFIFNIPDSSLYHDLIINVRNGALYEFSNLFLFIYVEAPNGINLTDTLEIKLAEKSGRWLGKGLGDLKSLSVPYKENVKFSMPGIYSFKIVQGMRRETLNEVYDVGIRVQKTQTK